MSEATPEDVVEQAASPSRDAAGPRRRPPRPTRRRRRAGTPVGPGEHVAARDLPLEADPADAAEQARRGRSDDEDEHR